MKYKLSRYKGFVDFLDEMTIPEAIGRIKNGRDKSKIKRILNKYQYFLFDKENLWTNNKIQCLSLLGILYLPAYWDKDVRKKRRKSKLNKK